MRKAQFDKDRIIGAATAVVAELGPSRASVARIATATGAPTGSIYHRFSSRDALLGEVWLKAAEAYQSGFLELLNASAVDPAENDALITYTPRRVRQNPAEARILLLHRREEFLSDKWPRETQERAERLIEDFARGHRALCERLSGRSDEAAMTVVRYAFASAPVAAVKPFIERNEPIPPLVDDLVRETVRASVSLLRAGA